jgi:threonine dehydrogenase-like Zn-dependent dehydrogenase
MNVMLGAGPVGLAAAIQAFVVLKVRDIIMMTWERYREIRFEKGREEGRQEVMQEIRQLIEQGDSTEGRHDRDLLEEVLAAVDMTAEDIAETRKDPKDRDLLEKILALVREEAEERRR